MGHEHDHDYMHAHNIPHEHDHEYMHQHGIPHDHDHGHEHVHGDEHAHGEGHCHGCQGHEHGGCSGCSADPRAELIAMMKYMVGHNTAHANELAALAKKLGEMGDRTACEQVMAAVSDFEKGNMRLSAVLAAMNIPQ